VFHTRQDGPPLMEAYKANWRYPWYTSYASTFSRPLAGGILSGEFVYNADKEYAKAGDIRLKEKDMFVSAIGYDKNFNWAWLNKINKGVSLITNITWYHYKLFDFDHVTWDSKQPESSWDKISIKLQTSFFDHTLLTGIQGTYDFNGGTDYVARLMYFPGDHFFYEVSYQQINENEAYPDNVGNQVIFNIRYEF